MSHLQIGQRIQVDLFGMRLASQLEGDGASVVTIVGLAPGAITVRLDRQGGAREITVGPGRVNRPWA